MTTSPARRLIVVFATLTALLDIVLALPGGPSYAPGVSFVVWLGIDALLVWRLWHQSVLAWILLLVSALMTLPLFFLIGPPTDPGSIAAAVLTLGATATLLAPPVLSFVWSSRPAAMTS